LPPPADKKLFTPGPLTTSATTRQAMLRDIGSRDAEFIGLVRSIRERLLQLARVSQRQGFEAVLVQGSGTYGVESVISSAVPPEGRLLVIENGAYGARMRTMASVHGIDLVSQQVPEELAIDPARVAAILAADPAITHVAVVHCETTTGLLNPLAEIAAVVAAAGRHLIVDAMSSFGAIPVDLSAIPLDYLITSSNKCIEGVPGFAVVLARREALLQAEGKARSLSLDLCAQWRGLEENGQFRFTPPTHVILAFDQALRELAAEGGVEGRGRRYRANQQLLADGMHQLGFRSYLAESVQGPIISTWHYPADEAFDFAGFYTALSDRGFVIYPGKVTAADVFRVGSVGRLHAEDFAGLLAAMRDVLEQMGVQLPVR
jgi:2-aminoethylphosphonate-pyruvate transaminase